MPRSINITGNAGKKYDLEKISTENTRGASSEELLVQIWYWNPDGVEMYKENTDEFENHKSPNPPSPAIGQIWLSKWVPSDFKGA